jgi:hypothetical protein
VLSPRLVISPSEKTKGRPSGGRGSGESDRGRSRSETQRRSRKAQRSWWLINGSRGQPVAFGWRSSSSWRRCGGILFRWCQSSLHCRLLSVTRCQPEHPLCLHFSAGGGIVAAVVSSTRICQCNSILPVCCSGTQRSGGCPKLLWTVTQRRYPKNRNRPLTNHL